MNALRQDTLDDIRAFRARRPAARCTCSWGPNPDCAVDHQGIAQDIAIAAEKHLKDTHWLRDESGEVLFDQTLWQLFVAGDDIEFCRRLRTGLQERADAQAREEVNGTEASL